MRFGGWAWLLLGVSLAAVSQQNQNLNMGHPQELSVQHHATPEEIRDRASSVQFQKDVKELSDLCAAVPRDMDGPEAGHFAERSYRSAQTDGEALEARARAVDARLDPTSPAFSS